MNRKELENQIHEIVSNNNMEVVEINISRKKNPYLEVLIYKKSGVTLDDCQLINKEIDKKIKLEEFFNDKFNIEVASPGLDRKLTTLDDYRRNLGNKVEIKTYAPVQGSKEFIGLLNDYNEDYIVIDINDNLQKIDRSLISVMKRYIEF